MRPSACATADTRTHDRQRNHYHTGAPSNPQPQQQQQQCTYHNTNGSPFPCALAAFATHAVCCGRGVLCAVPRDHLHHLGMRR